MTQEDRLERRWMTEPIKKFGDVSSVEDRMRRNLPQPMPHAQNIETVEIALRREADQQFRIKRTG